MKKSFIVWGILFALYLGYITFITYLFPLGGDEVWDHSITFWQHLIAPFSQSFVPPRIGCFLGSVVLHLGKWSFVLLNPLVQLSIILSAFYLLYLRWPNFKTLKDFPSLLLLMCLGTFFISRPNDTLFWIGGATNYSWAFPLFIWLLIYLRKLNAGKNYNNTIYAVLFLFWGISLGLMNENNAPMALCLVIAFAIYAHFREIKLNFAYACLVIGIIVGIYLLFGNTASTTRLNMGLNADFMTRNIFDKFLFHFHKLHTLNIGNAFIPIIVPLFSILIVIDKKVKVFKEENFYLSLICWAIGTVLALVLCAAPLVSARAFYSSSWFFIFSLFFLIFTIQKTYSVNILKYLALIFLLLVFYILPFFTLSHIDLYECVKVRDADIELAKQRNDKSVLVPLIAPINSLYTNLEVIYYAPVVPRSVAQWGKNLGIEIIVDKKSNEIRI